MQSYRYKWGLKVVALFVFMGLYVSSYAQLSVPGVPESFSVRLKSTVVIPQKSVKIANIQALIDEDIKYNIPNRYGTVQKLDINIKTAGAKTVLADKGNIWQYEITSENAYSLGIHFKEFNLPSGAKVFIYDESRQHLIGAFTEIDNNPADQLAIAEFNGRNAIIEYFEPLDASFSGKLVVGAVSQAYKEVQSLLQNRIGINCPQGDNWQDEKHAICRMVFNDTQYSYLCTGFLLNNVRQDGTPYFQTANHCISTSTEALTLVTYFNYENSTCSSNDAPRTQTLSGAMLRATNKYSDFSLLELYQYPPEAYNPYFAGWSASGIAPLSGTCIHHPEGTPKCISLQDNSAPTNYNGSIRWDNNYTSVANTHWMVTFNKGYVEGGSSGSPLFDDKHRVIGQLHGGDSIESFYGKLSVSWNYGAVASQQLKAWLDPDLTGKLTLDGSYLKVKPRTAFYTLLTDVCVGSAVSFTDQSKNAPTQWKWRISPSTYSFASGTDSTSENPSIVFNGENNYSVSLITANSYGKDSVVKDNYIIARKNIHVSMNNIPVDTVLCGSIINKYPVNATGAMQYSFTLDNLSKMNYSVHNDTIFLTLKADMEKSGSFDAWLKVNGAFGACKSADSVKLKVVMQTNNDIANAIRIWPGRNASYSNRCATVQNNEPKPPILGCNVDNSWCSPAKNSVWFTFVGPSSGLITINTSGFTNKVAVYRADTYNDVLIGGNNFKMVAAKEASSGSVTTVENVAVESGKTYWLQVDGSNGSVGNCTIDLVSNTLSAFPNPSNGIFDVIISDVSSGDALVEIYSLTGKLLLRKQLETSLTSNRYSIDASDYASGVYILKATVNGFTAETKLMIIK